MQWLATFLLVFTSFSAWAAPVCMDLQDGWHKAKAQRNVELYYRTLPANGDSEVVAQTTLNGDPGDFIRLLKQPHRSADWMANVISVELLSEPEPDVDIVHTRLNAPWPVQDRDMITRLKIKRQADGSIEIRISDAGQQYPELAGYVRMTRIKGLWMLIPTQPQQFDICYKGSGSASGHLPQWLSNKLLLSALRETFNNLSRLPEFSSP